MGAFKVSIFGESNVGKTTLTKMLNNQPIPLKRNPTIGVSIEKVQLDSGNACVWDMAGQRRFQFMWDEFKRGSSLSIIVTDSSEENVEQTKALIKRHLSQEGSQVIAIANKQDRNNSLTPEAIQQRLGIPTYGMIGIDARNSERLRKIVENHL